MGAEDRINVPERAVSACNCWASSPAPDFCDRMISIDTHILFLYYILLKNTWNKQIISKHINADLWKYGRPKVMIVLYISIVINYECSLCCIQSLSWRRCTHSSNCVKDCSYCFLFSVFLAILKFILHKWEAFFFHPSLCPLLLWPLKKTF